MKLAGRQEESQVEFSADRVIVRLPARDASISLHESDGGGGATMPHVHSELIEVKQTRKKGRGVFARTSIPKGTVIERVPVIVVPAQEIFGQAPQSKLADYVFRWGRDMVAIALGYGSLYNHSYQPNARFYNKGRLTKTFTAIRDIQPGEEITVNYNGRPRSRSRVGFRVV
jgi:hypothetical protein